IICPPPRPTLFPYTTLFRSLVPEVGRQLPRLDVDSRIGETETALGKRRSLLPALQHACDVRAARALGAGEHRIVTPVESYAATRSEEHTSELQSRFDLVCRL